MDIQTERTMITFKKGDVKFTYRIGGITIHKERVLFQKATVDPSKTYWFLPGGTSRVM